MFMSSGDVFTKEDLDFIYIRSDVFTKEDIDFIYIRSVCKESCYPTKIDYMPSLEIIFMIVAVSMMIISFLLFIICCKLLLLLKKIKERLIATNGAMELQRLCTWRPIFKNIWTKCLNNIWLSKLPQIEYEYQYSVENIRIEYSFEHYCETAWRTSKQKQAIESFIFFTNREMDRGSAIARMKVSFQVW